MYRPLSQTESWKRMPSFIVLLVRTESGSHGPRLTHLGRDGYWQLRSYIRDCFRTCSSGCRSCRNFGPSPLYQMRPNCTSYCMYSIRNSIAARFVGELFVYSGKDGSTSVAVPTFGQASRVAHAIPKGFLQSYNQLSSTCNRLQIFKWFGTEAKLPSSHSSYARSEAIPDVEIPENYENQKITFTRPTHQ